MKKVLKTLTIITLIAALAVSFAGCGAKSKAEKLLKDAQKVSDFDKIADKDEYMENFAEFVEISKEFYALMAENPDNEEIEKMAEEFEEIVSEWNIEFAKFFKDLANEDGYEEFVEYQDKFVDLVGEYRDAKKAATE